MAEKKKTKKKGLWQDMKKQMDTSKSNPRKVRYDYTEYLMKGGSSDFPTWKQENNR